MDNKLNYQQARRIRGQSLSDLFAEQLIGGSDFIPGFKKSIGLKTQARVKGIKEKFDPLNIARALTGGSRIGPAIVGKLLGRSRKDIEYFAGRARPVGDKTGNMTGVYKKQKSGDDTTGIKAGLSKILNFLEKSRDTNIKMIEKENNFKEEKEREEKIRFDAMMDALKSLIGKSGPNKIESGGKSLMDFFGDLKDKLKQRAEDKAEKKAAEIAAKTVAKEGVTMATENAVKNAAGHVVADAAITKIEQSGATTASKIAVTKAEEAAIKGASQSIIKKSAMSALTKLPLGIGLLFAANDVWGRIKDGDLTGAAIATASPLASAIPFVGTAAGIGLDLVAMTRDVYKAVYPNSTLEQDLINDPELTKKRLSFIGDVLQPMIKSALPKSAEVVAPEGMEINANGSVQSAPQQAPKSTSKSPNTLKVPKGQASRMSPEPAPVTAPPTSGQLSSVTETNNDLNLDSKVAQATPVNTTTNVQAPGKSGEGFKPQIGFASVRNQDDTLQRLLLDSTRVV